MSLEVAEAAVAVEAFDWQTYCSLGCRAADPSPGGHHHPSESSPPDWGLAQRLKDSQKLRPTKLPKIPDHRACAAYGCGRPWRR